MVKNLKIFLNVVFDNSNYAQCNAKNRSPLDNTVLEKIRKKCLKIVKKNAFFVNNGQFLSVLLDF